MTDAAIKRAQRRAENAELKARGICIDCYSKHDTGTMRCVPCGDRNRGGPKIEHDPSRRLTVLYALNASTPFSRKYRRAYDGIRYWTRRKKELEGRMIAIDTADDDPTENRCGVCFEPTDGTCCPWPKTCAKQWREFWAAVHEVEEK